MRLVLFDLDDTLLSGDSDYEWTQFLIEKKLIDREEYEGRNKKFLEQYVAGTLDIQAYLAFQLKPFSMFTKKQLEGWRKEFMLRKIVPLIKKPARALVAKMRENSDEMVIITATNEFVTTPIAEEFGIRHLISTEIEQVSGKYTGKPSGVPCFREGKVTKLAEWLKNYGHSFESLTDSWFFSDSINDVPLLEKVKNPVAVNADPKLAIIAKERGWKTLSW